MKESRNTEFKQKVTANFLKTVSAFANYDGGDIFFGIDDNGKVTGVEKPEQVKLDIENRINDSIHPLPDYSLSVIDSGRVIKLTVFPGGHKPYLYKSKAYKRSDTVTVETDSLEFRRLVLEGENKSFEELAAKDQKLKFTVLENYLKERLGIETVSFDVLKSLGLYKDGIGFLVAAELLSDENHYPGMDIVRFGEDLSTIHSRKTFEKMSVLSEMEKASEMYEDYYTIESISGVVRTRQEMIPKKAFRETVANALVHRTWDVDAKITVFMFEDRIEVTSPGGLVSGISRDEFLRGGVSITRNKILADVFLRVEIIEKLGTGIPRIREAYKDSFSKPVFEVYENSIKVILPCVSKGNMTQDEMTVYRILSKTRPMSTGEVTEHVPFGKSKVLGILKVLCEKNMIAAEGNGRGIKYRVL